jgi:hypothetical protein
VSSVERSALQGGVKKRCSELALSEVEGVNPEQTLTFRQGSRRVDLRFLTIILAYSFRRDRFLKFFRSPSIWNSKGLCLNGNRECYEVKNLMYVLENGGAVLEGTSQELMDNPDVKSAYFGL